MRQFLWGNQNGLKFRVLSVAVSTVIIKTWKLIPRIWHQFTLQRFPQETTQLLLCLVLRTVMVMRTRRRVSTRLGEVGIQKAVVKIHLYLFFFFFADKPQWLINSTVMDFVVVFLKSRICNGNALNATLTRQKNQSISKQQRLQQRPLMSEIHYVVWYSDDLNKLWSAEFITILWCVEIDGNVHASRSWAHNEPSNH